MTAERKLRPPQARARRPVAKVRRPLTVPLAWVLCATLLLLLTRAFAAGPDLDALSRWERQDMGVAPPRGLHDGAPHGPTPTTIPGGQVITTKGLLPLINGAAGMPVVVLDILGAPQQLPNAVQAVPAAQGGSLNDQTQQGFGQFLQQVTRGNRDTPLVLYCQGPQCWMSYNAAVRAIALGYRNVLWYRGGLEAWAKAGQPFAGGPVAARNGPPEVLPGTGAGRRRGARPQ